MNKLYRSRSDRVVAGVAGGIARYLGIETIFVRLFFILLAISDGIGLALYILLAILMPEAPESADEPLLEGEIEDHPANSTIIEAGLVLLGLYFLIRTLGVTFLPWFSLGQLWPLLLILGGAALLWRQGQEQHVGG